MHDNDTADYPDDRNGDQLRDMEAAGIDLDRHRMVAFAHVISDPGAATQMAREAAALGYEVEVHGPDDGEGQWEVVCRREVLPTHGAIGECEAELARIAETVGGSSAGWGCPSDD